MKTFDSRRVPNPVSPHEDVGPQEGTIYLLHFDQPYRHARHYLGWTAGSVEDRLARHRSQAPKRRGSALMRAVILAGIEFRVAGTWSGDRATERRWKTSGHKRRCPICKGELQ